MKYYTLLAVVMLTAATGMAEIMPTVFFPEKPENSESSASTVNEAEARRFCGAVPESYFGTYFGEFTPEKRPVSVKIYFAGSAQNPHMEESVPRLSITLFDADGNETVVESCALFQIGMENGDLIFGGGKHFENANVPKGDLKLPIEKGLMIVKLEKQPDGSIKVYSLQLDDAPKGKTDAEVYSVPLAQFFRQLEERRYTKTEIADIVQLPAIPDRTRQE